ncbi:MAG TPA: porin family protein [Flavobacterium sp.]|nr:porin family protein [Flavobacterium sp.]
MKKLIVLTVLLVGLFSAQAQLRIGIKAGPNFANLDGVSIDTKMKTGFHFGVAAELKLPANFAIEPEVLYSSQGAKVDSAVLDDIQYDYVTVPVLLKYYLISDLLSIEAGPQFSFLVNDNNDFDPGDSSTFDFAALGGVGVNLGKHLFLQGRYVVGLTDASANADVTNRVIQLSVGYMF